jgi:hypothetical protein
VNSWKSGGQKKKANVTSYKKDHFDKPDSLMHQTPKKTDVQQVMIMGQKSQMKTMNTLVTGSELKTPGSYDKIHIREF